MCSEERRYLACCEQRKCDRCAAYLAKVRKRDRRLVNLIFATVWVGIGTWALVALVIRILGL